MATAKSEPKYVMAKANFYQGEELGMVRKGDIFQDDHPVVKKHPTLFESVANRMRIR